MEVLWRKLHSPQSQVETIIHHSEDFLSKNFTFVKSAKLFSLFPHRDHQSLSRYREWEFWWSACWRASWLAELGRGVTAHALAAVSGRRHSAEPARGRGPCPPLETQIRPTLMAIAEIQYNGISCCFIFSFVCPVYHRDRLIIGGNKQI